MESERYTPDRAMEEASQMKEKINSGEATTYEEAERLIEQQKGKGDLLSGLDRKQLNTVMQHFCEEHDQNKFAREVVERETQYPGRDPFEVMESEGKLPDEGIIFKFRFVKGYEGVGYVFSFDKLDKAEMSGDDRIILSGAQGRQLNFGIENPNYFFKSTEPSARTTLTSYMPVGFDDLEILSTSDDGRALIGKKAWGGGTWGLNVDRGKDEWFSRIFAKDQLDELGFTITNVLQNKIGLSLDDIKRITDNITGKFAAKK